MLEGRNNVSCALPALQRASATGQSPVQVTASKTVDDYCRVALRHCFSGTRQRKFLKATTAVKEQYRRVWPRSRGQQDLNMGHNQGLIFAEAAFLYVQAVVEIPVARREGCHQQRAQQAAQSAPVHVSASRCSARRYRARSILPPLRTRPILAPALADCSCSRAASGAAPAPSAILWVSEK